MAKLINTPQEYLSQVEYDLQTKLGIKDTKLISSGPLSVLANLLSNIAFDAQKYYEYVTKEFNVATAQDFKSMLFHASIYSYNFKLAIPAHATAYLIIPRTTVSSNRKIKYSVPTFTNFEINNAVFRIEGEIGIEITDSSITAFLTDGIGTYQLDIIEGVDDNNKPVYYIAIPSEKIKQVERLVEKFVVPYYDIGDTISFNINIPDNRQIYLTKIYINYSDQPPFNLLDIERLPIDSITTIYSNLDEYELKYFKFNTTSNDKTIFADIVNFHKMTFTLGNGVYGRKLNTNDEAIIVVEYTLGAAGNVPAGNSELNGVKYFEIDTITNDTIVFNTVNLKIRTEIPASGGLDASDIEDMRIGILKKITERNSLITPLDFEKHFSDPVTHKLATVISRQLDTSSPLVTVYNVLHHPYTNEIVKTVTKNINQDNCFNSNNWCINPELTYENTEMISPFVYIRYNNEVHSYYKFDDIKIPLTILNIVSNPEIRIDLHVKWDSVAEQFYFECNNIGSGFSVEISSNVGDYTLDDANNYKAEIHHSSLIYDKFFKEPLIINRIKLINSNGVAVHEYNVVNKIVVMKHVQKHKIYEFTNSEKKILFVPFIEKEFYDNFNDSKYENAFVDYFKIGSDDIDKLIAFNISLNQTFCDTVAVDQINQDSIIINENSDTRSQYAVDIDIYYDPNVLNAKGLTLIDLKTDISLAVLAFLVNSEGNSIEMYETSLIRNIKDLYTDIIDEVKVNSPKTIVAQSWSKTIEEGDYSADEQLESTPTYYYFDVNNMNIKFIISKS